MSTPDALLYVTNPQLVDAYRSTRQEYNDHRGWTLPADENGDDAGFRVVDLETGHTNWFPEDVFRSRHTRIADAQPGELPHVIRMRAELAELEGRLAKLTKYLDTDASRNLPFDDLNLLRAQRMAMEGYKEILFRRLRRATTPTQPPTED